jgi:hypothetical protein
MSVCQDNDHVQPNILDLATRLAALPNLSTNYLKATTGVMDAIRSRARWSNVAFINQDEIRLATGMSPETAIEAVKTGYHVVTLLHPGKPDSFAHGHGFAGEWQLNLNPPASSVPWPLHAMSPGHLLWSRKAEALGPNAWRLVLALFHRDQLDPKPFNPIDIRTATGWSSEATKRTLRSALDWSLLHKAGHGSYVLNLDLLRNVDDAFPHARTMASPKRVATRQAWLDKKKTEAAINGSGTADPCVLTVLDPSPDCSEHTIAAIQSSIDHLVSDLSELEKRRWTTARPRA